MAEVACGCPGFPPPGCTAGSFLEAVAACMAILTVASACKFALPPARTDPSSLTATEAVLCLTAKSAAMLRPKSLRVSLSKSCIPDMPVHDLLVKVVLDEAEISTPLSPSILPATSTEAPLLMLARLSTYSLTLLNPCSNTLSKTIGEFSKAWEVSARRMMSPLAASVSAVRFIESSEVKAATDCPSAVVAFTRSVNAILLFACKTAPFLMSMLPAPSTIPLRVLI